MRRHDFCTLKVPFNSSPEWSISGRLLGRITSYRIRQHPFTSGSQKCLALVKNLYSISDLVALISLHSEVIFKVKVFKFKDTQWSDYPI
jgi:hypothetical protein